MFVRNHILSNNESGLHHLIRYVENIWLLIRADTAHTEICVCVSYITASARMLTLPNVGWSRPAAHSGETRLYKSCRTGSALNVIEYLHSRRFNKDDDHEKGYYKGLDQGAL